MCESVRKIKSTINSTEHLSWDLLQFAIKDKRNGREIEMIRLQGYVIKSSRILGAIGRGGIYQAIFSSTQSRIIGG